MAPAVALGCLDQPFNLSLGQVFARPVRGIGFAHRRSNCAVFVPEQPLSHCHYANSIRAPSSLQAEIIFEKGSQSGAKTGWVRSTISLAASSLTSYRNARVDAQIHWSLGCACGSLDSLEPERSDGSARSCCDWPGPG